MEPLSVFSTFLVIRVNPWWLVVTELTIVFIPLWVEGGSPLTASSTGFPIQGSVKSTEGREESEKENSASAVGG